MVNIQQSQFQINEGSGIDESGLNELQIRNS